MNKTVRICSEEWDLRSNKNLAGGEASMHPENDNSHLVVGLNNPSKHYRASVLMHEIIESILMLDNKRWDMAIGTEGQTDYLFIFDHDYLDTLPTKILDALISSGVFSIKKDSI